MNANQFEILRELADDSSSWTSMAHYPPSRLCRNLILLADFAAADSGRWQVCRNAFEHPALSRRELAALLGVSSGTIQHKIAPVILRGSDRMEEAGPPPSPETDGFSVEHATLSYRRGRRLCDFAASQPVRWRVIRLANAGTRISRSSIAAACGICVRSVTAYLSLPNLSEPEDFVENR